MKKAAFLSITWSDGAKGFITAFIVAVLTAVLQLLQAGSKFGLPELKVIAVTGITAGIGYLLKNVFTNSQDEFAKAEPK